MYESEAPWRLVLPSGGTLTGEGQQGDWPLATDGSVPANRMVVQLSESGSGDVLEDHSTEIAAAIVEGGGSISTPTQEPPSPDAGVPIGGQNDPLPGAAEPGDDVRGGGGCACSVPGAPARSGASGLLVLAALGLFRRRPRTRA